MDYKSNYKVVLQIPYMYSLVVILYNSSSNFVHGMFSILQLWGLGGNPFSRMLSEMWVSHCFLIDTNQKRSDTILVLQKLWILEHLDFIFLE